jgi:hypothetical protein
MYSDVLVLDSDVRDMLARFVSDSYRWKLQVMAEGFVSREKGKMQAKYRQRRLTICRTVNQGEWQTHK